MTDRDFQQCPDCEKWSYTLAVDGFCPYCRDRL